MPKQPESIPDLSDLMASPMWRQPHIKLPGRDNNEPIEPVTKFNPNHDEHGRFASGPGDGATHAASDHDPAHDIRTAERFNRLQSAAKILAQRLSANPRLPGEEKFKWQGRLLAGLDQHVKQDLFDMIRERYQPVDFAVKAAHQYRSDHGLPDPQVDWRYVRADANKGAAVAEAFTRVKDQSNDPRVREAYDDFKRQNDEQWDYLTRPVEKGGIGLKVTWTKDEAYPSAKEQADDVRLNHHLNVQNDLGHGHSLMSTDEYNRFRAVHDFFGHVAVGGGFDRHGEYAAWLMHNSMYTGPGRRAMSSEYHGSNSALWNGKDSHPHAVLLPDELTENPFDEHGYWVRKALNGSWHGLDGDSRDLLYEMARKLELTPEDVNRLENRSHITGTNHAVCAQSPMSKMLMIKDWEEGKHPRDDHGRWTSGGGADGASADDAKPSPGGTVFTPKDLMHTTIPGITVRQPGFASPLDPASHFPHVVTDAAGNVEGRDYEHPIDTTDVLAAAQLLGEGQFVRLHQTREVATLLDKLREITTDAEAKGEKAPTYDLCKVSVEGTNLFCAESKGIPRINMPQLSGIPTVGTRADQLPKNAKGEVDLAPLYMQHLKDMGVQVRDEEEDPSYLRASQNELHGGKVAGIMGAMREGKVKDARIFVSRDNYVVDGHHRWAAKVGVNASHDASDAKETQPIHRVDMPITDLLEDSKKFAKEWGIPQRGNVAKRKGAPPCVGCGGKKPSRIASFFRKHNDNHDDRGRFATAPGGGEGRPTDPSHSSAAQGGGLPKAQPILAQDISPSGQGRSRPVSATEFAHLAEQGEAIIAQRQKNRSPLNTDDWFAMVSEAHDETSSSWGGTTYDMHTGAPVWSPMGGDDSYAITAHEGTQTVAIPENSDRKAFNAAAKEALTRFRPLLEREGYALGFFHDDDLHRIDIDPVIVAHSLHEAEAIGAATHAVGGAYRFADGMGYWPPHVEEKQHVMAKFFHKPKSHSHHLHESRDPGLPMWCPDDTDDDDDFTKDWDESKHPRDDHGRFGAGSGGSIPKSDLSSSYAQPAASAPAFHEPLIAPDDERPEAVGPSGRGTARPSNFNATKFSEYPPDLQKQTLDSLAEQFPGTTPKTLHDNVRSLYDEAVASDPESLDYGTHWYEEANKSVSDFATSNGLTPRQGYGITASLSPNAEWGQNIAMAKFVMTLHKENPPINLGTGDKEYLAAKAKGKSAEGTDLPSGAHYNDLTPKQAAWATIIMGRREGLRGEIPTPKGTYPLLGWATGTNNLSRAVRMARGEDVDSVLNGQKVRSFFNNIADPKDEQGNDDITMDSHAHSAALKVRMSNGDPILKKLLTSPSSRANNSAGSYGLFADAYRSVAKEVGLTPNQLQAIVWSHWQHVRFGYDDPHGERVSGRLQARYGNAQPGGGNEHERGKVA